MEERKHDVRYIELQINGHDDRRNLNGILADNGYPVHSEVRKRGTLNTGWVVVEVPHNDTTATARLRRAPK